jgi:HEPN domain-containing protein
MVQPYSQADLTYDLFDRAEEFNTAYHSLGRVTKRRGPDWTRYFLLSQSIELALKAFLALHGKASKELRKKFGHNLNKLLKEATKRGLVLGRSARRNIELLEEAHNNHWARYPKEDDEDDGPVVLIDEEFEKTATELLEQVRKAIYPPGDGEDPQ